MNYLRLLVLFIFTVNIVKADDRNCHLGGELVAEATKLLTHKPLSKSTNDDFVYDGAYSSTNYIQFEKTHWNVSEEEIGDELKDLLLDIERIHKRIKSGKSNELTQKITQVNQLMELLFAKNDIPRDQLKIKARDIFRLGVESSYIYASKLKTRYPEVRADLLERSSSVLKSILGLIESKQGDIYTDNTVVKVEHLPFASDFMKTDADVTIENAYKVFGLKDKNDLDSHVELAEMLFALEDRIFDTFDDGNQIMVESSYLYQSYYLIAETDSKILFKNLLDRYMKMDLKKLKYYIRTDILKRMKYPLEEGLDLKLFINRLVILQYALFKRNDFNVKLVMQDLSTFDEGKYATSTFALKIEPRDNAENFFEKYLARMAEKYEIHYLTISPHDLGLLRSNAYVRFNKNVNSTQIDIGDYDIFRFFTQKSFRFLRKKTRKGNPSYTARHEWSHVNFIEMRDNDIPSIFHGWFLKDDQELGPESYYTDFMTLEELYTHNRNPFWMSDELLDANIKDPEIMGYVLNDIHGKLGGTFKVSFNTAVMTDELLTHLDLFKNHNFEVEDEIFSYFAHPDKIKGFDIVKGYKYIAMYFAGKKYSYPIIGNSARVAASNYYQAVRRYKETRAKVMGMSGDQDTLYALVEVAKDDYDYYKRALVDRIAEDIEKLNRLSKNSIIEIHQLMLSLEQTRKDIEGLKKGNKILEILTSFRQKLRKLANQVREGHRDFGGNKEVNVPKYKEAILYWGRGEVVDEQDSSFKSQE